MQKSRGLHVPHQKATAKVCVAKHEATAGFEQVGEKKRKSNQTTPSIIPDITVEHTVFVFCKRQNDKKNNTNDKIVDGQTDVVSQLLCLYCSICQINPTATVCPTIPLIQRRSQ